MNKAPDVIYLQWHGDAPTTRFDDEDNEVPIPEDEMDDVDPDEATWSEERIYDADIPYRRSEAVEAELADLRRENARLRGALRSAKQFIENGVQFGFITMPDSDDPAHKTLPTINAALQTTEAKTGQQIWPPVVDSANDSREAKTQTCRWKKTKLHHSAAWWPGCDPDEEGPGVDDWGVKYCPYCGKRISVEGV